MKLILAFEIKKKLKESLQQVCKEQSIELIDVPMSDYICQLGALARIQGFKKNPIGYRGLPMGDSMIVFSGIDSPSLDKFLDAYKATGAEPIAYKAILTPTNITWTPLQLIEELRKERKAILFTG